MTEAGTGAARFPALGAVLSAAIYAIELAAIAASYFSLAEAALLLPAVNPAANRIRTRFRTAARLSRLAGNSRVIFFRQCSLFRHDDRQLAVAVNFHCVRHDARSLGRGMADQSPLIRDEHFFHTTWCRTVCDYRFCTDGDDEFRQRDNGAAFYQ